MPKTLPNSVREAEKRLALLKAAFREVAERGFSNVTLEDIAVRAGVSKGVTLYYFDSKDELFSELFAWLIDSIHARMREAVAAASDPVAKVRALVALIFPSPSKNRAFFRAYVDFCGLAARREPFRLIGERFYEGCRQIDRSIVEEGVSSGLFVARDAGEMASTLRAIFDGLMLQWLTEPDPEACFEGYRERCERAPPLSPRPATGAHARTTDPGAAGLLRNRPFSIPEATMKSPAEMNLTTRSAACANEGCRNRALPGESNCETCAMERSLFRRDERVAASPGFPGVPARVESAPR